MNNKSEAFFDIRVWILLFFVVRLIGITNAPLEATHNWRQSSVNTISRNFQEIDNNILYPRFDTAGEKSGVSGTEFPIFNYLIYLCNMIFGYSHWYGRLINLVVSSFGVWSFYLVIRNWRSKKLAFYSSMILLASLWFSYSRKIMPDIFSLSLCMVSLLFLCDYIQNGRIIKLLVFTFFLTLGGLSKIPSIVILTPAVLYLFSKDINTKRKLLLVLASIIPIVIIGVWYFYWFPKLSIDYQLYRLGPGIYQGIIDLFRRPQETLENFYFDALKYSGFAIYLLGLVFVWIRRDREMLGVFLISSICFFVFMAQAGYGFSIHGYYVLPFIPIMALIAGFGLESIYKNRLRHFLLVVFIIEGIANLQHDFFIWDKQKYKLEIEKYLERVIPQNDLIAINGGPNPQLMYFAHRRGWTMSCDRLMEESTINTLKSKGARYLVWDKNQCAQQPDFNVEFENMDIIVFNLSDGITQ